MSPERFGQTKIHPGVLLGQTPARLRQISLDMHAGGEKIWQENYELGTQLDAFFAGRGNVGFSQFQERGLDNVILPAAAKLLGEVKQILIRIRLPAAMGDKQYGRSPHR